jgi:hypothetical protein
MESRPTYPDWALEEPEEAKVARTIRTHLGHHLRQFYSDVLSNPVPENMVVLLQRLEGCP